MAALCVVHRHVGPHGLARRRALCGHGITVLYYVTYRNVNRCPVNPPPRERTRPSSRPTHPCGDPRRGARSAGTRWVTAVTIEAMPRRRVSAGRRSIATGPTRPRSRWRHSLNRPRRRGRPIPGKRARGFARATPCAGRRVRGACGPQCRAMVAAAQSETELAKPSATNSSRAIATRCAP